MEALEKRTCLLDHLKKLYNYLDDDEIAEIYKITEKIINEYTYKKIEYVYIIKGKKHGFQELLYKKGTKKNIKFEQDEINKIKKNDTLTLSVIHNHTNSSAISYDDFTMLIIYGSMRNMIAFGALGNLYFMQKTNPALHFHYSDQDRINDLYNKLKAAFIVILQEHLHKAYPTLKMKEILEKIQLDEKKQNEVNLAAAHDYFLRSCTEYNFNYYPRS